jgi:hypothetical protein
VDVFVKERCSIDLTPLAEHGDLTYLDLVGAGRFTGVGTVAGLTKLAHLGLEQEEPWRDGSFLTCLPNLRSLYITVNGDIELSALAGMEKLVRLYLANLDAAAFESIGVCGGVEGVDLAGTGPVRLADIGSKFPNVRTVSLRDFEVELDGPPLTSLDELVMNRCHVGSLEPLASWEKLRLLSITEPHNELDLSPLAGMDVQLLLPRSGSFRGLEKLTPSVRVDYYD